MKTVHMQTQINLMNELSTVPVIGELPFLNSTQSSLVREDFQTGFLRFEDQ